MSSQSPRPDETDNGGFQLFAEYWPQMLLGLAVAFLMLNLGGGEPSRMFWLLVGGLAVVGFVALLFRSRKTVEEPLVPELVDPDIITYAPKAASEASTEPAIPAVQAEPAATSAAPAQPAPAASAKPAGPSALGDIDANTVLVIWGSETGNAQGLADIAASKLGEVGITAQAVDMEKVKADDLKRFNRVLVITSTWGDGDPPSNAISLWEALKDGSHDFSNLNFSVCALGDTSYPQFCKCGKDFDGWLESFGAKRIHPRVDCDLDYEAPFEKWLAGVTKALQSQLAGVS